MCSSETVLEELKRKLSPFRAVVKEIMVKAYGGVLILADFLLLLVKILYYIGEGIYRLFVPIEEKSVAGEIVLVRRVTFSAYVHFAAPVQEYKIHTSSEK